MPNPVQVGPLHLTLVKGGGDPVLWGMLTIGNDASGSPQITLLDNNGASVVGVINQPVGSDGSFQVTFQQVNYPGLPSLTLYGNIDSSVQVSGNFSIIGGGNSAGSGGFLAQLLPIQAPIQLAHHGTGTLGIDTSRNLTYTPSGGEPIAMGNVGMALDATTTGCLSQFTLNPEMKIENDTYTWIQGVFRNSTRGTGTIGPHSGAQRQSGGSGDDTWMPVGQ